MISKFPFLSDLSNSNNLTFYAHSETLLELPASFMDEFFVNIFAGRYTMGLMSFESRLIFLRKYCTYAPRDENYCYFQYIYEGLLKAANSGEIGNASYPGNNVYLRNKMAKYYHGYINYRGEPFPYDPEGSGELGSEEIAYHFEAMQLVFELVKQKLTGLSNLECVEPEHLASIFEANLGLNLDNEH